MSTSETLKARVTLTNKKGLHARASNKFVNRALDFDAHVEVTSHNSVCAQSVVADSVMELLLLGSAFGQDITISTQGKDAEAALNALVELVNNRFGEES